MDLRTGSPAERQWRALVLPLALLLCAVLATAPAWAGDRLVLTTGMREPWTNPDRTGFTDLLVKEVFRRIGVEADVELNLAAGRAIRLAGQGVDDGLTARVAGLEKEYPDLIRVPEKVFDNDFVAASLGPGFATTDWDTLKPHHVGYILGWVVFENNLPPVRELTLAKDSTQLLSLLKSGRIEVLLHERWQALWHARQMGMTIRILEPPLASVPMFMYLHRRHAALVPRIAAELAAMKADGSYRAIAERAFGGLGGRLPSYR